MSAAGQLQKAIFEALSSDPALTALLGPGRIFDRQVARVPLPYVVFAAWETRDWDTSTERGEAHRITLDIWSDENGRREAQAIAAAVTTVLHDAQPALATHHLVNLRLERSTSAREPRSRRHRASLQFRAVTEAT